MDQLAELLRARASATDQGASSGVSALLARLDEAEQAAAAAAAAASPAAAAAPAAIDPSSSSFGIHVDVRGPGAAGSTHLATFLHREAGLRCNLLVDPDGTRHAPWPPPPPPPAQPPALSLPSPSSPSPSPPSSSSRPLLVFLYSGDPLRAAASFFRRGIAAEQALKTTGVAALARAPAGAARERARAALARLQQAAARAARGGGRGGFPPSLDAWLERGEDDPFALDAHLEAWLSLPAASDVLFLRYEAAFEPGVARALFRRALGGGGGGGGDDDGRMNSEAERLAREWCAQRRERRTQLTAEQRAQGDRVFAAYVSHVATLPHGGCFVRPADPASRPREAWDPL
jgi:pyruvate/2-oxoglutarate dehydrogenase complex dihydrolipoamide acyltransferase (E2) component